MRFRLTVASLLVWIIPLGQGGSAMPAEGAPERSGSYSVSKKVVEGHTTYHLIDSARNMDLGLVPDIGNFAYEFRVNGKDVLIPPDSFKSYLAKRWFGSGIPFLAPFANRINGDHYYFEGKKYLLNDSLGNILHVPPKNFPLHGLIVFDPRWKVVDSGASEAQGAFVTSRLEFYKYPDLMAQFPFAHVYEVTYRLKDGKLECTTKVENVGGSPMPVHFGYHPYFRPDGPREEWTIGVGAEKHWIVDEALIPSGETEPTESFLAGLTKSFTLGKQFIDDGFSALKRDSQGHGHIWVKGVTGKIDVVYGKEFDFAIVYAPLDNKLICIEPQTGPTNAFNLTHEGKFKGLIVLDPGKSFSATYWIVPSGY
jgi:aldose 1-epimerase